MSELIITGDNITIEDVINVAFKKVKIKISPKAVENICRSRETVEKLLSSDISYYGINTGFGSLAETKIESKNICKLQHNLVLSHATGVGPELEEEVVRIMMFLRACVMAKGFSGVRVEIVKRLVYMLNNDTYPVIPSYGSVGASGDLAPLAHLALTLIGEGKVYYKNEKITTKRYYEKSGLSPLKLQAKEGLALLNGTQFMTALAILSLERAKRISVSADVAGAMSLEALDGIPGAFDSRIHELRPHKGQIKCAENIRKLIKNSKIIYSDNKTRVQDPYSLRCLPQVHGIVSDIIKKVEEVVEVEINSVTDNPLIFPKEEEIISGGNFHGQPIAMIMDMLSLAFTNLGGISERRTELLLDWSRSGLPPFLALNPGVESGYMIAHLTVASLLNMLKTRSTPSSSDSIPTSAGREDHVSFGSNAALKCYGSTEFIAQIIGIELIISSRAIDIKEKSESLGTGTKKVYKIIREKIPFIKEDHILSKEIEDAGNIVLEGKLVFNHR